MGPFEKGMRELLAKWEKEYMEENAIKVGDRVEAPRHGRGKVLAIVGDNAWVQTEVRDYPLTFDIKKLKKVPKPRQWRFDVYPSGVHYDWSDCEFDVKSVELTDEVRERLADLL